MGARKRSGLIRSGFEAIAVVAASLATLLVVTAYDITPQSIAAWIGDRDQPRPAQVRRQPVPQTAPRIPAARPTVPPPAPVAAIRQRESEQAQFTLSELMETCRYWSAQRQDARARTFRTDSCNRALRFAVEARLPQPAIPAVRAAPEAETRQSERTTAGVNVDECTYLRVGSIAYRQCRAREANRLREACRRYRANVLAAGANPTRSAWDTVAAVCLAADRYEIVR